MSQRSRSKLKTAHLFQRVIKNTLMRPEELTVSKWAEKYRVLSEASNISGKWSNAITPYLVGIMDAFNDPHIREIYFCKSTQVGGTEALINILCYCITQQPAPAMIVYPSDDLAKDISSEKLKPAFRLIPEVKKIFYEGSSKELKLRFKTMALYLRGAGSPSKLASKEIKYLFFDEIDKMGGASAKEASPFNLAMERTKTYKASRKVYACSTPTLATNYIWNLHDNADEVRHYFVPCPHCGEMIELLFANVMYDKDEEKEMSNYDRAKTAVYVCPECGCEILDSDKPAMLKAGEWRAVKKRGIGAPKSVGFWINSLYSVFVTWADAAEEFLKSKDDPEMLQNFVNSWLAEPWEDTKLKTNEDTVMERQTDVPELMVPEWAKILTAGVDVQETSFYYTIRAWGEHSTSQNIAHGQVLDFFSIERIMNGEFVTEDGRRMVVDLALIDSGYQADGTYDFCIDHSDWALPVKGASNPMRDRYKISKVDKRGSKAYGMQIIIVDGGQYKDSIAARMRRENGTGSWMVYKDCDLEYAKQVTSEHKVAERKNGKRGAMVWKQKHSHGDNHYLDCEVYAFAAAEIMGVRELHTLTEGVEKQQEKTEENYTPEESWIEANENWMKGG